MAPVNKYSDFFRVAFATVREGQFAKRHGDSFIGSEGGTDGSTVLNGSGAPSPSDGEDGDFYIDTAADEIYGPKASGVWGSGTSLVGPPGANGAAGTAGSVWRNGSGAPSSGLGINGDYYLDDATGNVYFKAAGSYSIVTNIIGPPGPYGSAGGDLTGTYPNPTLAVARALASRQILAGTGLTGGGDLTTDRTLTVAYGTSGTTAAVGNDARLSDSRAPNGSAGGDLTGTYPNPTIAALAVTDAKVAAANKDGAAGTPSMRTIGTGALTACAGNDSRLSDARAPSGAAGGDLAGTYPNPTIGTAKVTSAKIAGSAVDSTKISSLGIQISTFSVATGTLPGNVQGCYLNGYYYQPSTTRLTKFDAKTGLIVTSVAPPSSATFPASGGGAKYNASLNKIVCALGTGFALYDPTNDTFGSLINPTGWGQAGISYDSVSGFIYYSTLTGNRLARCDTAGANQSNGGTWTNNGGETFVSGTFVFGIENNNPSAGKLWKYTIASWPTLGTSLTLAGITNISGARMCQTAGGLLAIPVGTAGVQFVDPTAMTSSAIVSLGGTTGTQSVVYDSVRDHVIASDGGSKIWVINATTFAVLLGVVPAASAVNAGLGYDTDNGILWMSTGTSTPVYRFYV